MSAMAGFFLMAKTMKQMTKAGRDGNQTMVFFGDGFGEASDDVMKTHLPMAKGNGKLSPSNGGCLLYSKRQTPAELPGPPSAAGRPFLGGPDHPT